METAGWYNENYLGFTEEQCAIFLLYSIEMTAKQHRNALKQASNNGKVNRIFSR
jgi:hypothetical protein